jgi:hypothetical protein
VAKERYQARAVGDLEYFEEATVLAAIGRTPSVRLRGDITVQITGTATEATVRVERASVLSDPAQAAAWAPADAYPFDLTIDPRQAEVLPYREPTIGWWRVRVLAISGDTIQINIAGVDA